MQELSILEILILSIAAFSAGFIDAVVGGGGLIQFPTLSILYPNNNLASLFGTNKLSSFLGTMIAGFKYSKNVKINYQLLFTTGVFAFVFSILGAKVVSKVDSNQLKPFILVLLILIAIYTYFKKNFGDAKVKNLTNKRKFFNSMIIGIIIGFYDGFFGPGAGGFFTMSFVLLFGFSFLEASAYGKISNLITNIGALSIFIYNKDIMLSASILMGVFNITGNFIGVRYAIKKGNAFIRKIFLVLVSILILRYSYDVYAFYF